MKVHLVNPGDVSFGTSVIMPRWLYVLAIWKRSRFLESLRSRLTFILISKLYRQMYADAGIATDSSRIAWSARRARWLAKPCRYHFSAHPMPQLQVPKSTACDVLAFAQQIQGECHGR